MESDSYIKLFLLNCNVANPECSLLENIFDHPQFLQQKLFESLLKGLIHISGLHYCHVTLCYMLLRDSTIVMSHSVTCCYVTPLLSCHTLLHVVM